MNSTGTVYVLLLDLVVVPRYSTTIGQFLLLVHVQYDSNLHVLLVLYLVLL